LVPKAKLVKSKGAATDDDDPQEWGDGTDEVDSHEQDAREELIELFEENPKAVFFSRQLEIRLEKDHFHWITNRVIRALVEERVIVDDTRALKTGASIHLLWNKSFRYYKREAAGVRKLVEEYSDPNIAGAIGLHGEMMVLEGFARNQFVMTGRNAASYLGKEWRETGHNLDFIFERDGIAYGVEVKNTLGYMDWNELITKVKMCKFLGLTPLFVVRMLPKSWINEVIKLGGFVLVLKYQLYPWTHKAIAQRVKSTLGLPVDAPKALYDGTMQRFVKWHEGM
jgi:hypothetical protein